GGGGGPGGGLTLMPATDATYAATESASDPVTILAGMVGNDASPWGGDGYAIWSRTTWRIVLSLNPCSREAEKAASRSGPTFPVARARARVGPAPHFARKRPFPPAVLESVSTPPVPQPPAVSTAPMIAAAVAARLGRSFFRVKPLEGLCAGRVDREHA